MDAKHETAAWIEQRLDDLVDSLSPCKDCPVANTARQGNLPGQKAIIKVLENLMAVLFPGCHGHEALQESTADESMKGLLRAIATELADQCQRALAYQCRQDNCGDCDDCATESKRIVGELLDQLPAIRGMLQDDIWAAYEGDPAATSIMEVVMSYPGLYAVSAHRIAHALYRLKVPLIPRVMSEYAHVMTGIDIHPGAEIGKGFFIDHGTGVVIGETCVIGRNVKIYQGVTLGALSFTKDADGKLIKGIKRHPNVEDRVIIYAGATILGGDTTIGHDSIIGANVWLVHSVAPRSKVYSQEPRPLIRGERRADQLYYDI